MIISLKYKFECQTMLGKVDLLISYRVFFNFFFKYLPRFKKKTNYLLSDLLHVFVESSFLPSNLCFSFIMLITMFFLLLKEERASRISSSGKSIGFMMSFYKNSVPL